MLLVESVTRTWPRGACAVASLVCALASLACERGRKPNAEPEVETGEVVASAPLGPIPPAGPLAEPKSLRQYGLPLAMTRAAFPADNPQTSAKIALGQRLFFDGRLSANGTVACSSCHDPKRAFTDGRPVAVGIQNRIGQRNAPTILNALYNATQFWDGRALTLETQALFPITNPAEMGQPGVETVVRRLAAVAAYRADFQSVFGRPVNAIDLSRALASYERSQIAFDSRFDRFIAGDSLAIELSARRGWRLFNGKARCNKCHALTDTTTQATTFTDNDFHNIGVGIVRHDVAALADQAEKSLARGDTAAIDSAAIGSPMSALGRYLLTRKKADIGAFKTPDLRNVVMTAPYFHDGSAATLWDVMDHYNKGDGLQNPFLDQDIQPLALTEREISDLVSLMGTLTSKMYAVPAAQELARQRQLARTSRPQRDSARAFGPKPTPAKAP